jgi:hypothetical protein
LNGDYTRLKIHKKIKFPPVTKSVFNRKERQGRKEKNRILDFGLGNIID